MIIVMDLDLRITGPLQVCLYEKHLRRILKIQVPWDASYIVTLSVGLEGDFAIGILKQIPLFNLTCTTEIEAGWSLSSLSGKRCHPLSIITPFLLP